jgi:hypothetical protein
MPAYQAKTDNNQVFAQFDRHWRTFLYAVQRIYKALKVGAKGDVQAEYFVSTIIGVRRGDPLLSYVQHARDVADHGLDQLTGRTGTRLAPDGPFLVSKDGLTVRVPENTSVGTVIGQFLPPSVNLVAVKDRRFGNVFAVPTEHLKQPLPDSKPTTVAKLAIDYMELLLSEAEAKFCND